MRRSIPIIAAIGVLGSMGAVAAWSMTSRRRTAKERDLTRPAASRVAQQH